MDSSQKRRAYVKEQSLIYVCGAIAFNFQDKHPWLGQKTSLLPDKENGDNS